MGLIGLATRAGKIVFGTDACLEQIIKRNAKLVIVAKDASERTIKNKCIENNVMFYNILTVDEISKCIGKDNKAVIGIKDNNIAKEIAKKIDGGEVIG